MDRLRIVPDLPNLFNDELFDLIGRDRWGWTLAPAALVRPAADTIAILPAALGRVGMRYHRTRSNYLNEDWILPLTAKRRRRSSVR